MPAADIRKFTSAMVIHADLPGIKTDDIRPDEVRPDDVRATLQNSVLKHRGERCTEITVTKKQPPAAQGTAITSA